MKKLLIAGFFISLATNVICQNVGIGTNTPTARLDVNGSFRLRGNGAAAGRYLVSDADGNASWQTPVAFRAQGTYDNQPQEIYSYPVAWQKVRFNQIARYNYGAAYQPINSEFFVPYNGVYHFDVNIAYTDIIYHTKHIRLQVRRGNSIFTIAEKTFVIYDINDSNKNTNAQEASSLSLDMQLEAQDYVYVEVMLGATGPTWTISPNPALTWFTGHLITHF